MGKIIQSPIPYSYPTDWSAYEKHDADYIESVRKTIKSADPYAGKVLQVSHADGYAQYMVKSLKPVVLIHLPVGDAWDAPYVHRMTANDIKWEIGRRAEMTAMFARTV